MNNIFINKEASFVLASCSRHGAVAWLRVGYWGVFICMWEQRLEAQLWLILATSWLLLGYCLEIAFENFRNQPLFFVKSYNILGIIALFRGRFDVYSREEKERLIRVNTV